MKKKFKDIPFPLSLEYSSDSDHVPFEFYLNVFPIAKEVDMHLGYFSSNAIKVLSSSFAQFIYNGGKLRLAINNFLSSDDKAILTNPDINDEDKVIEIIKDFDLLKATLGKNGKYFFDCLKFLLKEGRLEIVPIQLKGGKLSHFKKILFYDGEEYLYINGSSNFTAGGVLINGESFRVDASWQGGSQLTRIENQRKVFEQIISKNHESYVYLDVEQIKEIITGIGEDKDKDQLVEDAFELLKDYPLPSKVRKMIQENENDFEKLIKKEKSEPKFPYKEGPREYQNLAYQSWKQNGFKGIFAMATGTGKTLTSLNCLLNEYNETNIYRAVILVPTIALLEQWKKECFKFNFKNVITVSSKEKWSNNLAFFNTANKLFNASFIVIVTYSSFSRPKFKSHFNQLPDETLLIADEVHNMGAPNISKLLTGINLIKRIGLSATPNRKYDMVGNLAINDFFNDSVPYVYEYSMKQALEVGWLSKYKYYPHIVYLTPEELIQYIKISKQLLAFLDPKTGNYRDCEEVEKLLLKRKRIIHKAHNKIFKFKEILQEEYKTKNSLKYTLVYVPEGKEADYSELDEYIENEEEISLINEYTRAVSETDDSIMVKQYTSSTKNRDEVINNFGKGIIDVLTSMKCLDEGVDVPRSELAIFCASTGNPRQFIQRRGRVLRIHDDKVHATIHDLVVVPKIDTEEGNYEMERNLLKKELERVVDFSELSMNKMDTYNELEIILDYYNLNLNDLIVN